MRPREGGPGVVLDRYSEVFTVRTGMDIIGQAVGPDAQAFIDATLPHVKVMTELLPPLTAAMARAGIPDRDAAVVIEDPEGRPPQIDVARAALGAVASRHPDPLERQAAADLVDEFDMNYQLSQQPPQSQPAK